MKDRYNVSKLLEVLACREIAKEYPVSHTKVTLNFVSPSTFLMLILLVECSHTQ